MSISVIRCVRSVTASIASALEARARVPSSAMRARPMLSMGGAYDLSRARGPRHEIEARPRRRLAALEREKDLLAGMARGDRAHQLRGGDDRRAVDAGDHVAALALRAGGGAQ